MRSETTFSRLQPPGRKTFCDVCGATGWGPTTLEHDVGGDKYTQWQVKHLHGHPYHCSCGRLFVSQQSLRGHIQHTKTGTHEEAE